MNVSNEYADFHTGPGNACESGIGAESGCLRCQQFDGEAAALIAETDGTAPCDMCGCSECPDDCPDSPEFDRDNHFTGDEGGAL
jgi:hypothetical protein